MINRFKASENYILRKVAGRNILVSVGEGVANFCGVITLNESAVVLWNCLKEGAAKEELIAALTENFDVTNEQAALDVENTLKILEEHGMITHE